VFKFKPYGPFEIPIVDGEVAKPELRAFWEGVEDEHPGLQDAVGCYVFATKARGAARPWYVGKTEKASFKKEAFHLSKLENYRKVLKARQRGVCQLYLIARVTDGGRFRKAGRRRIGSISKLEELLIGACLIKNPKLVNKSTTKHLREIHVPGYMNEQPGARSREAQHLSKLLRTRVGVGKKIAPNED
jgi:hypothetical protein